MSSPRDNDDSPETDNLIDIQASRTNMAILHFLMTAPKWSISLFLFLAARCVPLRTPHEAIDLPLTRLRTVVELESLSYQQCTMKAFDHQQKDLMNVAEEEFKHVLRAQDFNKAQIDHAQELAHTCGNATTKARNSLIQWRSEGMDIAWVNDTSSCTENDMEYVTSFLREDYILVENEVSLILDDYITSSQQSMDLVYSYAIDRVNYDVSYFVSDRIQPALDFLDNKTGVGTFRSFIDNVGMETHVREALKELESALVLAKSQIESLKSRLADFSASIDAFYDAYTDVYNRLVKGVSFLQDFLPPGTPIPTFLDISSVPLGASLLPSSMHFPVLEDFQSTKALLDNATYHCLDILNGIIIDLELQANHKLRGASSELASSLSSILSFHDYNPPKFIGSHEGIMSLLEEMVHQSQLGEAARNSSERVLNNLQLEGTLESRDFVQGPKLDSSNFSFTGDSTSFHYLQPSLPTLSVPEFLGIMVSWLLANTWIIEVVLQGFRLWRLEGTYSRGAIPDLPEIDYGEGDETQEQATVWRLLGVSIFKGVASPRLFVLVVFSPICVAVMALWYPHVKLSCVSTENGTYLANKFLSPLLINEANALGNAFFLKGEFQCHQCQQAICDQMHAKADFLYQSDLAALHAIEIAYNQSVQPIEVFQSCVGQDTLAQMDDSCCGLKGFPFECSSSRVDLICPIDKSSTPAGSFRPLNEYLSEPACNKNNFQWTLTDARYNCRSLTQSCDNIPCSGVNEDFMKSQIIKTDCEIELYALSCISFLILFVYHAVAVNIVSSILFKGIRQIMWRKVSPFGIGFRTRLRENGNLAKGGGVSERSGRIALAIKRFELLGWVQIILGVLALIGWALSILVLKSR